MSTRLSIEQQVVRRLGGRTGSITSGDASSATMTDLIAATARANDLQGDLLIMPDAANVADTARIIEESSLNTGRVTWVGNRTDVTYTSETFMLIPKAEYTKVDLDNFLNDRLQDTRRAVMNVIPTWSDSRFFSLAPFTWIRNRADVLAVYYRSSPNLIDNSRFDVWGAGPAAAPTSWTAGSATISRNEFSSNAGRITRGAWSLSLAGDGGAGTLDQYLPPELVIQLRGLSVTFECDVLSSGSAVIRVTDTGGTTSATHTTGGDTERLTLTHTVDASADSLYFRMESPSGVTSHFDNAIADETTSLSTPLSDTGDDAWSFRERAHTLRDIGGVPVIELRSSLSRRGQLVVFSRQPFPTVTSDSIVTDCPDSVIVPGLMFELMRTRRAGVNRDRPDVIEQRAALEYARMAGRLLQVPVPDTQETVSIRGG